MNGVLYNNQQQKQDGDEWTYRRDARIYNLRAGNVLWDSSCREFVRSRRRLRRREATIGRRLRAPTVSRASKKRSINGMTREILFLLRFLPNLLLFYLIGTCTAYTSYTICIVYGINYLEDDKKVSFAILCLVKGKKLYIINQPTNWLFCVLTIGAHWRTCKGDQK